MFRLAFVVLALTLPALDAQDNPVVEGVGPLISIISPDSGATFAFGTVKSHALVWNKHDKILSAQVTFVDTSEDGQLQAEDDTHRFRLPGVTYDETHKLFLATTLKGEQIPVARLKKQLFFNSIEVLPNAIVRIEHRRGAVTVVLEATRPTDPSLQRSESTSSDSTHAVDIRQVLQ